MIGGVLTWFALAGYGGYVWSAYGLSALLLMVLGFNGSRRKRRARRAAEQRG